MGLLAFDNYKYNFMEFIRQEGEYLIVENLFNEEHAAELISNIVPKFTAVVFKNTGIKIMRLILNHLQEVRITHISIDYNWNRIMTTPQLVCYDKNQWKTLQQLQNWNRQWNQLFASCYFCTWVALNIECSWMDRLFVQELMGGLAKLANIKWVHANLSAKNGEVGEVLSSVSKAKIFQHFDSHFKQLK